MIQPPRRLVIQPVNVPLPIRFGSPYGTAAFRIAPEVLYIYVEPYCHPLDWDLARGLMTRIADPALHAPGKVPSVLAGVEYWSVELVDRAHDRLL